MPGDDVFLQKLLATFRVEADAHVQAIGAGLQALKKTPAGQQHADILETVFREVHSLKGAARAVSQAHIEAVCQSLEDSFAALRNGLAALSPAWLELLLQAADTLGAFLAEDGGRPSAAGSLIGRLEAMLKKSLTGSNASASAKTAESASMAETPPSAATGAANTLATPALAQAAIRVSPARVDAVMRQAEELLLPRLALDQHAGDLRTTIAELSAWKKRLLQIQPALRTLDRALLRPGGEGANPEGGHAIPRLLKYLDEERFHMKAAEEGLAKLLRAIEKDRRMLAGMTDALHQDVKEMQLLPFSSLLDVFPRYARELARERDKAVELSIQGGSIEIDRHILQEIKDPLIHMLRNCIDHGIEPPAARLAKGKPPHGRISLACTQKDSGVVEIRVADDGAGVAADRVAAAARKLGACSSEQLERLDPAERMALVFQSGVSTAPAVTDISGRGLGLAIVREKIERLGGSITLESSSATGTTFHMLLPLMRANFRGVLVHIGEQLFVIPCTHVERVMRIAPEDVHTVENHATILVDEKPLALAWLGSVLELGRPATATAAIHSTVLILAAAATRMAFTVERIAGEQEVLVKTLRRPLVRIRNIAGVSVLGTGQVVPVLNVPDLMKTAIGRGAARPAAVPAPPAAPAETAERPSILVVEDSVTSRTLLKTILESAGYRVGTAVDGVDGYTALKTEKFDLVVSDVEMPRMDGFDLTAAIRADRHFAELPVVLVTALESREHRERGIDVGASAYLAKSGFDQSNLLEVVRRLIGAPS